MQVDGYDMCGKKLIEGATQVNSAQGVAQISLIPRDP